MLEFLLDNALTLAGYAIAFSLFLIMRARKRRQKKKAEKIEKKLKQNKENQKEKEKELKKMGKFLCDCCGKETAVRNAKQYDAYDVCPVCAAKLAQAQAELNAADEAYKKAITRCDEAKKSLVSLFENCKENRAETQEKPIDKWEKPANPVDDISKKLGI